MLSADFHPFCSGSQYVNPCSIAPGHCQLNTLRLRPNRRHFADAIFKYILLNENIWISIKLSLKNIPKSPINNIPASVQIMAWRRLGDKPLSEPMVIISLTHICITRPQISAISCLLMCTDLNNQHHIGVKKSFISPLCNVVYVKC